MPATLSVAFLVKNPPMDRFAMLVEYMRVVATEIVVVNTGMSSEDRNTILSWAERYEGGVTIIDHVWKDDFSEARNVGLEACTGDWTLVLDPDELPSVGMISHIRAVLDYEANRPHALGWLYWTVNYWGGVKGEEKNYHWHIRLFRTGKGKFYRPVHELVELDGVKEDVTRGTNVVPFAPPLAYLIHSKAVDTIAESDALYERLGDTSR